MKESTPKKVRKINNKNFKNIGQMLRFGSYQLTIATLIEGQIYNDTHGWVKFTLDPDAYDEIATYVAYSLTGGTQKSRSAVYRALRHGYSHWAFERFRIKRNGKAKVKGKVNNQYAVSYCAGQDMVWELNALRAWARNA